MRFRLYSMSDWLELMSRGRGDEEDEGGSEAEGVDGGTLCYLWLDRIRVTSQPIDTLQMSDPDNLRQDGGDGDESSGGKGKEAFLWRDLRKFSSTTTHRPASSISALQNPLHSSHFVHLRLRRVLRVLCLRRVLRVSRPLSLPAKELPARKTRHLRFTRLKSHPDLICTLEFCALACFLFFLLSRTYIPTQMAPKRDARLLPSSPDPIPIDSLAPAASEVQIHDDLADMPDVFTGVTLPGDLAEPRQRPAQPRLSHPMWTTIESPSRDSEQEDELAFSSLSTSPATPANAASALHLLNEYGQTPDAGQTPAEDMDDHDHDHDAGQDQVGGGRRRARSPKIETPTRLRHTLTLTAKASATGAATAHRALQRREGLLPPGMVPAVVSADAASSFTMPAIPSCIANAPAIARETPPSAAPSYTMPAIPSRQSNAPTIARETPPVGQTKPTGKRKEHPVPGPSALRKRRQDDPNAGIAASPAPELLGLDPSAVKGGDVFKQWQDVNFEKMPIPDQFGNLPGQSAPYGGFLASLPPPPAFVPYSPDGDDAPLNVFQRPSRWNKSPQPTTDKAFTPPHIPPSLPTYTYNKSSEPPRVGETPAPPPQVVPPPLPAPAYVTPAPPPNDPVSLPDDTAHSDVDVEDGVIQNTDSDVLAGRYPQHVVQSLQTTSQQIEELVRNCAKATGLDRERIFKHVLKQSSTGVKYRSHNYWNTYEAFANDPAYRLQELQRTQPSATDAPAPLDHQTLRKGWEMFCVAYPNYEDILDVWEAGNRASGAGRTMVTRQKSFVHLSKQLENLVAQMYNREDFDVWAVITGSHINQDAELAKVICTPGMQNYAFVLGALEDDLVGAAKLSASLYDLSKANVISGRAPVVPQPIFPRETTEPASGPPFMPAPASVPIVVRSDGPVDSAAVKKTGPAGTRTSVSTSGTFVAARSEVSVDSAAAKKAGTAGTRTSVSTSGTSTATSAATSAAQRSKGPAAVVKAERSKTDEKMTRAARDAKLKQVRESTKDALRVASRADLTFDVFAPANGATNAFKFHNLPSELLKANVRIRGWPTTARLPPQVSSSKNVADLRPTDFEALQLALGARGTAGVGKKTLKTGLQFENVQLKPEDLVIVSHDYATAAPVNNAPFNVLRSHWMTSHGKSLPCVDGLGTMLNATYNLAAADPIVEKEVSKGRTKVVRGRKAVTTEEGEDEGGGEDDANGEEENEEENEERASEVRSAKNRRSGDSESHGGQEDSDDDAPLTLRVTRSRSAQIGGGEQRNPTATKPGKGKAKAVSFAESPPPSPSRLFDDDNSSDSGADAEYCPTDDEGRTLSTSAKHRKILDFVELTTPPPSRRAKAPSIQPRPTHRGADSSSGHSRAAGVVPNAHTATIDPRASVNPNPDLRLVAPNPAGSSVTAHPGPPALPQGGGIGQAPGAMAQVLLPAAALAQGQGLAQSVASTETALSPEQVQQLLQARQLISAMFPAELLSALFKGNPLS